MAIKAFGFITDAQDNADNTYHLLVKIWSGTNYAEVYNDTWFDPNDTSVQINTALVAFIKQYSIDTWSVSYGMLDRAVLINPVSLV